MSDDLDLSGAHPAHWPEARRRIDVVQRFLLLHRPTTKDLATHAAMLSMSTDQFRRLIRAWRQHRDAGRLPGIRPAQPLKRRSYNILPRASASIMKEVIDEMTRCKDVAILAEIRRRCQLAETPAPSSGTVSAAVKDARAAHASSIEVDNATALVLASCWIALPLALRGEVQRPRVALALALPAGQVIKWRWSGTSDPRQDVLADVLATEATVADSTPLRLYLPDDPWAWKTVDRIRQAGGDIEVASFGSRGEGEIASTIGRKLGGVPITLRRLPNRDGSLIYDRRDQALSEDDMTKAIATAVDRHNSQRVPIGPMRFCRPGAGAELAEGIRTIDRPDRFSLLR